MARMIDVTGREPLDLLIIAERACASLCRIAGYLTTDEGDPDETEEEFGLSVEEIVSMAHDDLIRIARSTLNSIDADFPKPQAVRAMAGEGT